MNSMSRRFIKECILRKRDDVPDETPLGKPKMLDETCRTVEMARTSMLPSHALSA